MCSPLSPPAMVGTGSTGITGIQGPARWRWGGPSPWSRQRDARKVIAGVAETSGISAVDSERLGQVVCFVSR